MCHAAVYHNDVLGDTCKNSKKKGFNLKRKCTAANSNIRKRSHKRASFTGKHNTAIAKKKLKKANCVWDISREVMINSKNYKKCDDVDEALQGDNICTYVHTDQGKFVYC